MRRVFLVGRFGFVRQDADDHLELDIQPELPYFRSITLHAMGVKSKYTERRHARMVKRWEDRLARTEEQQRQVSPCVLSGV